MFKKDLSLSIPNERRSLHLRLSSLTSNLAKLQQLIIIAMWLHSHMDKETQITLSEAYQKAGFTTLQFNFMGHGDQQNKSDGKMEDITLSSSIKDLKTVWDYALSLSNDVNTTNVAIGANNYGAFISLMALEKISYHPKVWS